MDNWEITTNNNEESRSTEYELSGNDYIILSNVLIYNAILLYKKAIKKKRIPATFIKFYFYEIGGYDYLFDEKLRLFFEKLNSKETQVAVLLKTFANSYPYFVVKEGVANFAPYIETSSTAIPRGLLVPNNLDVYIKNSIESLEKAIEHYNNSDELKSLNYIFKDYLYNTYKADIPQDLLEQQQAEGAILAAGQELNTATTQNNQPAETKNSAPAKKSALLTGRVLEIPKQKGKVVSVLFPELPLPSAYPVLDEKSRINPLRKIRRFLNASEEIIFINNKMINQIKYSLDFVNKRKVMAHDLEKANRFDFKF